MLDYAALAALSEIIRRGSFEAAAAALGVTPSAVSQRIKGLEERLGQVLIHRGPPASGTETGLRLMQHLDQVRLLETTLAASLRPTGGPAVLRLAVNADSLATWFPPVMTALPVLYDLVVDDQDHARDWLRQGQVSAAISSDPDPVPGCDALPLGAMRYLALATPDFLARHFPDGVTEAGLRAAPAITFNAKDALQSRWAQKATGRRLHLPGHLIPASEPFARAVELGLGWGMIPESIAAPALHQGRLQPLVPDLPLDVALHWHVQRAMAPALAPLTAAIRKRAAAELRP
ncbi:LysR family transcriptional regulator ArgP [Paracoccus denitrificans]|jgi:LysR family transcriptional regulator (chromosome initiation inhibitor)|uniref:Transcriptional regulator, LysR family n=1 Tax=Paracoccus denitrificans (strain Pd 1222) TaxID=318586 RepID=A1B3A5_PARDP|nr:LysR family transcriptional regulator ArgP [Paracoccus denitrificans]ABL69999.1 transcriptional regulator, LysR family [Paracoccus denitrificans PD1222]MBB4627081.1 LysR family transcriptional regulator (chromosome initiation inhibitor) [Paracoccus denitrificans]MCU7428466.1 LysR family transcriptional regulator ArgP [Paracoccus denitrificans]QAR25383.1 LysR family transcriptional regulator ArgP [Paracoccus denitrificans]UPV94269.1 LysR family transcriptional regulator ArgP [Paracoccus deni